MNPNGKIDISNLPDTQKSDFFSTEKHLAPENELQRTWHTIWQAVLDLETVSTNDDFFKIGGNSVLAIKLISEINSLGYRYTPLDIFKHPTIAMLSKLERISSVKQNKPKKPHNSPFTQISTEELARLKKLMN